MLDQIDGLPSAEHHIPLCNRNGNHNRCDQRLDVGRHIVRALDGVCVRGSLGGKTVEGGFRTMRVTEAPPSVVDIAVRAARLIGKGLYGVDLKKNDRHVLSLKALKNLEEVEKLSRRIRGRMKRY